MSKRSPKVIRVSKEDADRKATDEYHRGHLNGMLIGLEIAVNSANHSGQQGLWSERNQLESARAVMLTVEMLAGRIRKSCDWRLEEQQNRVMEKT